MLHIDNNFKNISPKRKLKLKGTKKWKGEWVGRGKGEDNSSIWQYGWSWKVN